MTSKQYKYLMSYDYPFILRFNNTYLSPQVKQCRDEKEKERKTFHSKRQTMLEVKLCSPDNPSLTQILSICLLQIVESTYFFIQEYFILGKQQ